MAKKAKKATPTKAAGAGAKAPTPPPARLSVARNRRATYDYDITERLDAGLVLTGTEIKSIRNGQASIQEAYVRPQNGEAWLLGAHIAPYAAGNQFNHEPKRERKLLLHKREILKLEEAFDQKSLTIVPIHLYIARGLAKLEIGVGRGRRSYDKRDKISARDAARQMREALRH
ncbi:MAG: SsrA-binding protein [Chloroflexi bacterium]|nr:MAG: SsrA-binding protein [Chloroflexota bacterium]